MMAQKSAWGLAAMAAAGLTTATGLGIAFADAPTVTVNTNPAGPIIYLDNPGTDLVQVIAGLVHNQLKDLTNFDILVDSGSGFASIIGGVLNPYKNGPPAQINQCTTDVTSLSNYVSCTTNLSNIGQITVNWTPAVGLYTVKATAKHASDVGSDTEEVQIAQTIVSVEYPAPPAVANAYINATYGRISGACRGYIISNIALNHGQDEKYGAKPGPYDEDLIHADVVDYKSQC